VLGVAKKMEAARQAEQNAEFKERSERMKPILNYLRSEKKRQEHNAAMNRPDNAKYGQNGRIEGISSKPPRGKT
jgi:hypothetical protein